MRTIALGILILTGFTGFASEEILVADIEMKVGGISEEVLYYAFEQGDKITIDLSLDKKSLTEVYLQQYDGNALFQKYKTEGFEDQEAIIAKTAVYQLVLSNNTLNGRIAHLTIKRTPSETGNVDFNTTVDWVTETDTVWDTKTELYKSVDEYQAHQVVSPQKFYINSGSNASLLGGKSRVTFPIDLPDKTVEWYYIFSAHRNESDIDKVHNKFNLFGEIADLLLGTQGLASLTLNQITKPAGGDVCDVYLLDYTDSRLFEAKDAFSYYTSGTRENFVSGSVQLKDMNYDGLYIGIRNPDGWDGIFVSIEVVAITHEEDWDFRTVPTYKIEETTYPVVGE